MPIRFSMRHCGAVFALVLSSWACVGTPNAMAQPDLSATLDDTLSTDVDTDTQVDRGDTVSYTVTLENNGTQDAESVAVSVPLDPSMTFEPGSVIVAPIALDDGDSVVLGGQVILDLLANDRDVDGTLDAATLTIVTSPTLGTAVVNPLNDGTVTYTSTGTAGADSFTYTVEDNDGLVSREALVTVFINTCPTARDDAGALTEGGTLPGDVFVDNGSGADSDTDGDAFVVTAVNGAPASVGQLVPLPSGALLQLDANGIFSYDANNAFEALASGETDTDAFTYTISDGACSDDATVTLTISGENDCPTAQDDAVSTGEDTALNGNVLSNNGGGADADLDATDSLVVVAVDGVPASVDTPVALTSGALLTVNASGAFTYDPNGAFSALAAGEFETDTFSYDISDGLCTDQAIVTVTINGANDCPAAADDAFATTQSADVTGNVLADNGSGADADPDTSDVLTVTAVEGVPASVGQVITLSSGATVLINADGDLLYSPNDAFNALDLGDSDTDTFTYSLSDGACPATGTVTITVSGLNDCPVAAADALTTGEETPLSGSVLTDNGGGPDSDADSADTLVVTELNGSGAALGVATVLASGATVTLNADGTFDYNPAGAFNFLQAAAIGNDGFTYTLSDGTCPQTGTVSIAISGINDCPTLQADDVTTDEDTDLTGSVFDDNGNGADVDPDTGDTLAVTEVNGSAANVGVQIALASGALLTVGADGAFTYDPNDEYEALDTTETDTDSFTYTADDPSAACAATQTVTLTINGVNDCPVANDDAAATAQNTPVNGDVLADNGNGVDTDADDSFTVSELNGASGAIGVATALSSGALVTLNANGTFSYDTNGAFDALGAGVDDTDTFSYTLSDSECSDTGTVTITITGVNDCPEVNDDADTTDEETPLTGGMFADNGSGADTDPEGGTLTVLTVDGSAPGLITLASGATLDFSANGTFTYDPNDQFEALPTGGVDTDTFTYIVDDGSSTCTESGTFTVTINGVNDCPIAQDDGGIATDEDSATGGDLFANNGNGADNDADGDSMVVTAVNGAASVGVPVALPSGAQVTVSSGGTMSYNPLNAFQSLSTGQFATDSFTYTISDGTCADTATVTIDISGVSDSPIAAAQSANTFGNIEFVANSGGLAATPLGTPSVSGTLNLKDGAVDPDTAPASLIVVANSGISTNGGGFQVNADGSFNYQPPVGFSGANDTFAYQISDGVATSSPATVTISVSASIVWFINNTGGGSGGAGTSNDPFRTVADFNAANGTPNGPAASERIYIFEAGTNYSTGLSLLNGQTVEGEGVALVVNATTLLNAGTRPTITSTTNHGVSLAQNNTLSGFNIADTPGFYKISGTAAGTVTTSNMILSGTGGVINITTSAAFAGAGFDSVASPSSPGSSINLVGCTGTLGLGSAGAGIGGSAAGAAAVNVSGGSVSFTYRGSLTKISAGRLIQIADTTGGAINFDRSTTNGLGGNAACTGILIDGCAGSVILGGTTAGTPPYVSLVGPNGLEILGDATNNQTGAVTINNAAITTTSGNGITVNGDVSGAAGNDVNASIAFNNVDITNPAALVLSIQGMNGGTVDFDSASAITRNNGGQGILVNSNAGGSISVGGSTKTLTTNTNTAVSLTSNTGATIDFPNGGLDIDTTSATGFSATGGGTVTVQGSNNTIDSTSATALNVNGAGIGVGGLNFLRVSAGTAAAGPAKGISLVNAGTGGLTITGTGTTDGSGGVIQDAAAGSTMTRGIEIISTSNVSLSNMTLTNANRVDGAASDGTFGGNENTDENGAIHLQSAANISLTNVDINGAVQHGINGNLVTNLDLSNSVITNTGLTGVVNATPWESGIYIFNLRGTAAAGNDSTFSNVSVTETGQFNIYVQNNAATNASSGSTTYAGVNRNAMDALTMTNMTFADSGNMTIGDHVTVFNAGTANFRTVVNGTNTFSSRLGSGAGNDYGGTHTSDGIQVDASETAHSDFEISGCTIGGSNAGGSPGQAIINVSASGTGFATFNIHDNPSLSCRAGVGINVAINADSEVRGFIQDNPNIFSVVGNNPGAGINAIVDQTGKAVIVLDNNVVTQQTGTPANGFQIGLRASARNAGTGELDLTVINNTVNVANSGTNGFEGITVDAGNSSGGESNIVKLNLSNNSIDGFNSLDYFLTQYAGNTFAIQGLTGSGANAANVNGFVAATDTDPSPTDPTVDVQGGLIVNYSNASPSLP